MVICAVWERDRHRVAFCESPRLIPRGTVRIHEGLKRYPRLLKAMISILLIWLPNMDAFRTFVV